MHKEKEIDELEEIEKPASSRMKALRKFIEMCLLLLLALLLIKGLTVFDKKYGDEIRYSMDNILQDKVQGIISEEDYTENAELLF